MLEIESGLFSGMVMQRGASGVTAQPITGRVKASTARTLQLRIWKGKRAVAGFEGVEVGRIQQGRFSFVLRGLGVGGPYNVQISLLDAAGKALGAHRWEDIYVGDVWILAGQSNMEGIGWMEDRLPASEPVRAFYMDHTWGAAQDPLHELDKSVLPVHHNLSGGKAQPRPGYIGAGPGVAFAQALQQKLGVPQGLLACAHGGTSMAQWDPERLSEGGESLFGAAIHRLQLNGGGIAGVYWYQGCSDTTPEDFERYTSRMKQLIAAFRKAARAPKLPFVLVQLSRFVSDEANAEYWTSIREQQRLLSSSVPNVATVPAIDLELDDLIHVSGKDQNCLGQRSALAAAFLLGEKSKCKPPIGVGKLRVIKEPNTGLARVEVEFSSVAGSLRSGSRPSGFTLHAGGKVVSAIFKTSVSGNRVSLMTNRVPIAATDLALAYGYGPDPYCNIVDEQGRSLPAFGPLPLGKARALTDFADDVEVSRLMPAIGSIKTLKYPSRAEKLGFARRHFGTSSLGVFLCVRPEIERHRADAVVYFRTTLEVPEPMSGRLCLGYDGPLKIWLNKREIFCDPKGTNPVSLDEAFASVKVTRGRHEVVVALGTNHGNAWGIVLRFQRLRAEALKSKNPQPLLPRFLSE